jgi:ABC-type multidrug transport system ATPase subunit
MSNIYLDTSLAPENKKIDISFKNILYEVEAEREDGERYTKKILDGVSGVFKAGELSVIMGASGAGKTTLLNVLAGRVSNFGGETLANGAAYDFHGFGGFANYVMQGDVLMETLTVAETLTFAATLRVRDEDAAAERVEAMIRRLKLEKCRDVLVGGALLKGVSGGEKKRTSLAVELLSDPWVIVLDEPTSGMDSLTSFVIVSELRALARAGRTVFLTIHQPNSEIYALFDALLLLVEGRLIYHGRADAALAYFADNFGLVCPEYENPADYFMAIMHPEDPRNTARYPQYFDAYAKTTAADVLRRLEDGERTPIVARKSETLFAYNVGVLLKRDLRNIVRNPIVMQSRICQVIFMSIYTGGLYFNAGRKDYTNTINWYAIIGYMFFVAMDLYMQAMIPVAITFPL